MTERMKNSVGVADPLTAVKPLRNSAISCVLTHFPKSQEPPSLRPLPETKHFQETNPKWRRAVDRSVSCPDNQLHCFARVCLSIKVLGTFFFLNQLQAELQENTMSLSLIGWSADLRPLSLGPVPLPSLFSPSDCFFSFAVEITMTKNYLQKEEFVLDYGSRIHNVKEDMAAGGWSKKLAHYISPQREPKEHTGRGKSQKFSKPYPSNALPAADPKASVSSPKWESIAQLSIINQNI